MADWIFKVVVLGDAAVGKTSLVDKYIQNKFTNDYRPTLGVNIITKDIKFDKNDSVRLILWDIAGQSKYDQSRRMFFQGIQAALFVYDVTRPATFKSLKNKWTSDLKDFGHKNGTSILIGNKADLVEQKKIETMQGESFSEEINSCTFIETSAKSGDNVEEAFRKLVLRLLNRDN